MGYRKPVSAVVPFVVLAMALAFHSVLAADGSAVPGMPGWFQADIGDTGLAGSASQRDDTWFVSGAGSDIWGTSDSFHFVYVPIDGDADISVLVRSQTSQQPFAKAGLMIRQSLDPSSAHVVFDVKPDGGIELMARPASGSATTFVKGGSGTPNGTFLRLQRRGRQITAYTSDTSRCSMGCQNWTPFSDAAITLVDGPVLIGLAVTSHDPAVLSQADLDFWGLSTLVAPWQQTRFFDAPFTPTAANNIGSANEINVPSGGADVWGTADSFNYVWQAVAGDATITAQVTGMSATNPFAKAGLMFRGGLTASAADVVLDVKPDGGLEFMARAADGSNTTYLAGGPGTVPVFLRLQRFGTNFNAWYSGDGQNWTLLGTVTVDTIDSTLYYAGLATTTHDPGSPPYMWASFANVNVFAYESPTNLATNGDFEQSVPPGLSPGWSTDRAVAAVTESGPSASGSVHAACRTTVASPGDCGLYQDIVLPQNGTYIYFFETRADKVAYAGVNVNGVGFNSQTIPDSADSDWKEYGVGFSAKAGDTVRVWVYAPATSGAVLIDNVRVVQYFGPR